MQLVDCFDDLAARFLLNLPYSEISSLPRFCFQVEEAQWFYEDFIRPMAAANGQQLPNLPLRQFSLLMFQHCPLWNEYDDAKLAAAYDLFLEYKVRVPVRGAILLDDKMERVVLVKGYKKGANWSFPRGKINRDEDDLVCAIREVYEETGFDVQAAGLVPQSEANVKYIDITMREQHMRMFVFRAVPLDTHFEPQTRKEISKVQFYNLKDLPGYRKKNKDAPHDPAHEVHQANKFYMVAPFLGPLKKWIGQQRRSSGYVSTDANQYDTTAMAGEDTDDGFSYHIPEVSNEEKSEALRKLLSIGALPQSAIPPAVIDPDTYGRGASQHAQVASVQPLHDGLQSQVQHARQRTPHQSSLLQLFQNAPQHPQALADPARAMPAAHIPSISHHNFQNQHNQGQWPGMPQQQHPHFHAQQPVELSATSPQMSRQGVPFLQAQAAPPRPSEISSNQSYNAGNPRAPDAAQLAPPQKMLLQLLSAPKQQPSTATARPDPTTIRKANPQASKLLDLLRSPTAPNVAPVELSSDTVDTQRQQKSTEQTVDLRSREGLPTLSEFTRTLPSIPRSRQPTQQSSSVAKHRADAYKTPEASTGRSTPTRNGQDALLASDVSDAQVHHAAARQTKDKKAKAADSSTIPSKSARATSNTKQKPGKTEAPPIPSFTILTRPDSAKNSAGQTPQAASLPTETSTQGGQLRDGPVSNAQTSQNTTQNQSNLLALFGGKSAGTTQASPTATDNAATSEKTKQQQHLLNLFEKSPAGSRSHARAAAPVTPQDQQSPQTEASSKTSPPASQSAALSHHKLRAQPEQQPGKLDTTPQNHLLGLFKKNASLTHSPETPISPFMLGSPQILRRPQPPDAVAGQPSAQHAAPGLVKRNSTSAATPVEARGFLLDYLNGVVQKEGNRG